MSIMEDPIVKLQSGLARGLIVEHEEGFNYYAFKGIPYGEKPIGELRFQDPIAKKPWTGVLDCKDYGPFVFQHDCTLNRTSYSEDALRLNVFSWSINRTTENKPVIFVVHGGGFLICSSDDFIYGPEYLIRKDIVLVLINYRLGILGFLNLEDEFAPGNQGIKDQLMALQWVQQNIRQFGGDPNNVTVLAESAGAVSAHYLALLPSAKGLIHKIICMGGVVQSSWPIINHPRENAIKICKLLGKDLTDSAEIVRFLKTVDTESLLEAQEKFRLASVSLNSFPFGPGKDDKSLNPVIPNDAETLGKQAIHIPVIVGCNSQEGTLCLFGITRQEFFEKCNDDYNALLLYNTAVTLSRYNLDAVQMKRLYYGDEEITNENIDNFVRLSNEVNHFEAIHRFARIQVEQSKAETYLYMFSYASPTSIGTIMVPDKPSGASHFDDLPYFFKPQAFKLLGFEYFKKGSEEYRMMEQLTEMWVNFATHGKPTVGTSELIPVNWTPVNDGTQLRYLNIDKDITMESTTNLEKKFLGLKKQ